MRSVLTGVEGLGDAAPGCSNRRHDDLSRLRTSHRNLPLSTELRLSTCLNLFLDVQTT